MRVDYHHSGTSSTESLSLDTVLQEGQWAGSRTNLVNWPDYGKYRFDVLDKADGRLLFSQTYSTLFGEWQTTDEAKVSSRTFEETVRFPYPRAPVILRILSRNSKGRLVQVFETSIDPSTHLVRKTAAVRLAEVVTVNDGGDPSRALDIVVLIDGYTREQAEKARRDLARFARVLLATRPFDSYRDRISIRGVLTWTEVTGPDEPRKRIFSGSALGTTFNTFDSERYLTTVRNRVLRDLAAQVPYDAIYVMVNTSRYGGAGIYNFFSIFVSDNEYDEYVFVHEFGHGFAGLGDEYFTSSVAYSEFYPPGVEPSEPNITALLSGARGLKWKALATPGTPVPTPNEPAYDGQVGAFEGAGYAAKGLYRPALDCKMMSKKQIDFCPVCMEAVKSAILLYLE